MFTHILVPLDGSKCAEQAIPVAMRIARASRESITFLRSVRVPVIVGRDEIESLPFVQEAMEVERAKAVEYLAALARSPMLKGITITTEVVFGSEVRAILGFAQSRHISLIVMCVSRASPVKRWTEESVAQQVVRRSGVPVLLLQECNQVPFGLSPDVSHARGRFVVLVAVDGSRHAEGAVLPAAFLAAELAVPAQGVLHPLRVVRLPETTAVC